MIIQHKRKWYACAEKLAPLLGLDSPKSVHAAAKKGRWDSVVKPLQGGRKKYYAVDHLPLDAQLKFRFEIEAAPKPDSQLVKSTLYANATNQMRARADYRLKVLEAWHEWRMKPDQRTAEADRHFAQAWNLQHTGSEQVSRSSLHRWHQAFRESGIDGLIDKYSREGKRSAPFDDDAKKFIEKRYLDDRKRDIYSCFMELKRVAQINDWSIPSYATCKRHILGLHRELVVYFREGRKTWEQECYPSIQRDPESIQPGEVYVMDDRMADVSFGEGRKDERVWATVCMDMRTGKIMSAVFPWSGTSHQAVLDCAYQAFLIHCPRAMYLDNGKNYVEAGKDTKERETLPKPLRAPFAQLLGANNVHWALRDNARSKTVERIVFREMARTCDKSHPGYTGMNVLERPDSWYLTKQNGAFLNRQEVIENIRYYFENIHNNRVPENGQSANQLWEEYFKTGALRPVGPPEYLRQVFLRTWPTPIKIRNGRIQFGKLCNGAHTHPCKCRPRWYWDEALHHILGNQKQVLVKYSDFEPWHIWIYKVDGTAIAEVPIYSYNQVPVLGATEKVGNFLKGRKNREKELQSFKERYNDLQIANVENVDDPKSLMQRADIAPAPEPNVDKSTGEILEKIEPVILTNPMPATIEAVRQAEAEHESALTISEQRLNLDDAEPDDDSVDAIWDRLNLD